MNDIQTVDAAFQAAAAESAKDAASEPVFCYRTTLFDSVMDFWIDTINERATAIGYERRISEIPRTYVFVSSSSRCNIGAWASAESEERCVQFFVFDASYVEKLRSGDARTEAHFVSYFSELIRLKLRVPTELQRSHRRRASGDLCPSHRLIAS